jgi:hypothetical protein
VQLWRREVERGRNEEGCVIYYACNNWGAMICEWKRRRARREWEVGQKAVSGGYEADGTLTTDPA